MSDLLTYSESEDGSSPYRNVAVDFVNNLRIKGLTMESAHHLRMGVVAKGGTNESGDASLFEKVRSQAHAPNGYLIGIGAANVFSMLEAFAPDVEPKAILLFDIEQEAVDEGQAIIDHFTNSAEYPLAILGEDRYSLGAHVFPEWGVCQYREAIKKYAPLLHKLAAEGRIGIARMDFTNQRLMPELQNLPDV